MSNFLMNTLAETALKKLVGHMKKEGIKAYLATVNEAGEIDAKPVSEEMVILKKSDFEEMKQKYFQLLYNGNK